MRRQKVNSQVKEELDWRGPRLRGGAGRGNPLPPLTIFQWREVKWSQGGRFALITNCRLSKPTETDPDYLQINFHQLDSPTLVRVTSHPQASNTHSLASPHVRSIHLLQLFASILSLHKDREAFARLKEIYL